LLAVIGGWCGQLYIRAQLCVKREMSNARAPVLGHFGAAIAGIVSIRAYQAQSAFRKEVRIFRTPHFRISEGYWDLLVAS
jgi:hypothetical protein